MTVDICTEVLSMLNRLMGRISELETRLNHLEVEHLARRMDITTVETPIVEKPAMESVPVQVERMSWPEIISQLVREAGSKSAFVERTGVSMVSVNRWLRGLFPNMTTRKAVIHAFPKYKKQLVKAKGTIVRGTVKTTTNSTKAFTASCALNPKRDRGPWGRFISQLVREAGSGRLLGERIGWTERKISRHIYDVDVPSQQDFNCVITHIPEKIDAANAALNNALNETLRK